MMIYNAKIKFQKYRCQFFKVSDSLLGDGFFDDRALLNLLLLWFRDDLWFFVLEVVVTACAFRFFSFYFRAVWNNSCNLFPKTAMQICSALLKVLKRRCRFAAPF